jgi:glutathione peroxidase
MMGAAWLLGLWALAQEQPAGKPPAKPEEPKVQTENRQQEWSKAATPLEYKVKDIDGNEVDLAKYKGKVVMIVNVASRCGFTKQYTQLQELHEKYSPQGLCILAFPSNDFGRQEPDDDARIKEFCKTRYSVGFDLFSKSHVKGEESNDVYKFLTSKEKAGEFGGDIQWNFTKFLIDRNGKVVARFEPRTKPDAAEVVSAIEGALAKK